MSDLLKYGVRLEYQNFRKTLQQTKKSVQSFNKMQETALKRQIALKTQLNRLDAAAMKMRSKTPSTPVGGVPSVSERPEVKVPKKDVVKPEQVKVTDPKKRLAKGTDDKTKDFQSELSDFYIVERAMTKRHDREEKERTRASIAEYKARADYKRNLDNIENARRKQAVKKLTEPTGVESMRGFYKEQEKLAKSREQLTEKLNKKRKIADDARFKESVERLTKGQGSSEMKKYYKDLEKESTKQFEQQNKQRQKIEQARRKQAVGKITEPSGAESMRSFYKEQERAADALMKKKQAQSKVEEDNFNRVEAARRKQAVDQMTKPSKDRDEMAKHYRELERTEARRVASLQKARDTVMHSNFMLKKTNNLQEKSLQYSLERAVTEAKTADEVRRQYKLHMANNRQLKKQNFLVDRLKSSSQEFAGNMVSAFAVAGAGVFITQTGQQFEAVQNTMLAVSEDSEAAAENFKFVQEEAFRLGLGLQESAKGFAKMVAARGDMSMEDTEQAFLGVAEMSTLLGLSADESNRAINALQQMMSKGVVSAEELKLQMGEVMPNAIQLMAKAAGKAGLTLNGTVSEMLELQQTGGLIADQVLPHFAQEMRNAAAANGGLEKAINSNRVAMNRMFTSFQMAANEFFTGGFSEGLTEFFNATAKFMKKNSLLWSSLGKILGSVMKGLAWVINEVLTPAFSALGSIFNAITSLFGDFSGIILGVIFSLTPLGRVVGGIFNQLSGGKGILAGLGRAFGALLAPIMLALGALEELAEFFAPSGKKTLIGTNIVELKDKYLPDLTKSVKGTVDRLKHMESEEGKRTEQQALRAAYPTPMRDYGTGYGAAAEATIRVESVVNIDGEKVGEAVAETAAMEEAYYRAISNSNGLNTQ